LGELKLVHPYYHCCDCGSSDRTWQNALRLGDRQLTRAGEELVALAGLLSSFGEAAGKTLRKLSGMRLSESTVRRATEDAGERLRELLDEQIAFQPSESWDWNRDAAGRSCAYVSVDATGVRQQGERAAKADGRMTYVGMIYNPSPVDDAKPIAERRYLAGLYDLTDLGRQLHREALSVGWNQAEVQIALSDGAPCLEKFLKTYFPQGGADSGLLPRRRVPGRIGPYAASSRRRLPASLWGLAQEDETPRRLGGAGGITAA
jgi:hypothetical protein